MEGDKTELIARAFIAQDGQILLCKRKDRDYSFFPGGHVEFGEFIEDALKREIKEEIDIELTECNFIGMNENFFEDGSIHHHEVNIVFEARVKDRDVVAQEDWLKFHWIDAKDLEKTNIFPLTLKNALVGWVKDGKNFWVRQNDCLEKKEDVTVK